MPLTSYPFSLLNISAENAATTSKSLIALSTTAVEGLSTLNEAPYAMSEFNGYNHTLPFVMSNPIRQSGSGTGLQVAAYCSDCSNDQSNISFRVRRVSGNTYFEVKSTSSNNVKAWYTAAGAATTIGTSYTTIGTMTGTQNNSITAMKMDWTTSKTPGSTGDSTFTAVDNTWRTLTNAYNTLGVKFSTAANNSGVQGDQDVDSASGTMNIYMRGGIYDDTLVSSISYSAFASATAYDFACFPAGSMVTLADGRSRKTIETVEVGEELLGNEGSVNTVLELKHHESMPRDIYAISGPTQYSGYLNTTATHPILTTDGWKAIDPELSMIIHPEMAITQLEMGDILIKYSHFSGLRYEESVQSIVQSSEDIPLYNFDVSGNDTYIVDEYVVHNK
jgi:hypothetical protein